MKYIDIFKNLLLESLKEHKKLIIGFYIIFILCFIASWIYVGSKMGAIVQNMPVSQQTGLSNAGAMDLFIHNESGAIVTYLGSVFFGITSIVSLIYNAINLGMIGQLFNTVLPNGGIQYILYLIPHGIFEITATVIQSVSGILLFQFIWRFIKAMISNDTQGVSDSFILTKKILIQSIVLMIFVTILLVIAAPIEAYVSVPLSDFIMKSLNM